MKFYLQNCIKKGSAASLFARCLPLSLLVSCAGIATPPNTSFPVTTEFGLCHAGTSGTDEEYQALKELGARWVRIDFSWSQIEPSQGVWDFSYYDNFVETALKNGYKILAILDYDVGWLYKNGKRQNRIRPEHLPLFLNYVERVAKRYEGRVAAFEIWNEPNHFLFWKGSKEEFITLTKESAKVLKQAAPNATVVGGAVSGYAPSYIENMFKKSAFESVDVISFHPYDKDPQSLYKKIARLRALGEEYNFDGTFWITEVGYANGGLYPHRAPLEKVPEKVVKTMTAAVMSQIELVMWYSFREKYLKGEEPFKLFSSEPFFGLAYKDYELKPGGHAFSLFNRYITGGEYLPDYWGASIKEESVEHYTFYKEGIQTLLLWTERGKKRVTLSLPPDAVVHNIVTGTSHPFSGSVEVTSMPIMISSTPPSVEPIDPS